MILVATKADKIPRENGINMNRLSRKTRFDPADTFIVFSSVTKEGPEKSGMLFLEMFTK